MKMIVDLISGERLICHKNALSIAKKRVIEHNTKRCYKRGCHYPEDAYYEIEGNIIYIKRR